MQGPRGRGGVVSVYRAHGSGRASRAALCAPGSPRVPLVAGLAVACRPGSPQGPKRSLIGGALNTWSWGCLPAPWPRAKGSGRGFLPASGTLLHVSWASTCWEPALCHEKGAQKGGGGGRPGAQGLGVMQQLCPRAWPQISPPSASHVATCQLPAVTPEFRIEGLLLGPTSGKSHLSLLQEPVCTQRDGALPGEGTVSLNLRPTPRQPSLCPARSQKESSEFQNSGSVPLEWPHSGLT